MFNYSGDQSSGSVNDAAKIRELELIRQDPSEVVAETPRYEASKFRV